MRFLIKRERLRRISFYKIETRYRALKIIMHNKKIPVGLRWEATILLAKLIKKNSPVSFKKRCFITSRGRGYLNFFKMSRHQILKLARNNELPGIFKHSW